jgi:5-methylthioribose kinase
VHTINPLTSKDPYRGRTAPLTSKRSILYINSTNTGTKYFKHGIYSLFFFQNAVCVIIITYLVPVLFTFYIQDVLKLKKIISAPKG